ncbi:MAG TPA: hypothetical protein VIL86_01440 [Tepidisphaeraceae bacterium]|jgi:hypothetical protein
MSTTDKRSVVESLEGRTFFSVAPIAPVALAEPTQGIVESLTHATRKAPAVPFNASSLIGTWDGSVKIKLFSFVSKKYDGSLTIDTLVANPDGTYTITGSATVNGKTTSGTATGTVTNKGKFAFVFVNDDGSPGTKVSGKVTPAGTLMKGKINVLYNGKNYKGSYSFRLEQAVA